MTDLYNEFDKTLYRNGVKNLDERSGDFGDGSNQTGFTNGIFDSKNADIGGRILSIDSGQNINTALKSLSDSGGGTLRLAAGTYVINGSINGYSSIKIVGVSPSATTIDFNSTSSSLTFAGINVYSTGTISSITGGVNVTGSGTSWLSNITAGQYLFIGTRHYKIAAVTGDTTLILQEGYTDNLTFPGVSYRICTPIVDVEISNLAIKSSTSTGVIFTDALQVTLDNVVVVLCNKGLSFTNVSRLNLIRTLATSSTSNGFEFTNIGLCDWSSVNASANGGSGFVFSNGRTISGLLSSVANTADGFNFTNCDDMNLTTEASSNGGQGIEFAAGCDNNHITGVLNGNASDGIKLTATSDNNTLGTGLRLDGNGGYGINIAASSCDTNTIAVPSFGTNSSGDYNDSGTNTNIVSTVPTGYNFTGWFGDGLTSVTNNSTTTRDLLTTDAIFAAGSTGWRLYSKTFGQVDSSNDFDWQNADYEFLARVKSDTGNAWSGSTEGRGYLWGLVENGFTVLSQPSNQYTNGAIFDESIAAFYVDGADNLNAISGNGQATTGVTGLANMDLTDLSSITHTVFHDYKIETHYDTYPTISNTGFLRPTAHSGGLSSQSNMYDGDTNTAGFADRSGGGDSMAISWDGGTTYTPYVLNTINAAKTVVTIGGQYDTFGRTWSPSEFSNSNFILKIGYAASGWNGSFTNSVSFNTFNFDTSTWASITGIEIELTSETEDDGSGGVQEHKIYDIRVKVYYTTTSHTGYVKFYVDNALVATHTVSIPRFTENPMLFFAGGPNGSGTSGRFILFNNYSLTANIN